MNGEKLAQIRQAEQSAKMLLKSVEESSNAMMREAQGQADKVMQDVKNSVQEYQKKTLDEFRHVAGIKAGDILSELDREIKAIDTLADREEKRAVSFLQDQMKVFYGNK